MLVTGQKVRVTLRDDGAFGAVCTDNATVQPDGRLTLDHPKEVDELTGFGELWDLSEGWVLSDFSPGELEEELEIKPIDDAPQPAVVGNNCSA